MISRVKRSGFSMIELVFVIVILGVLAAVAVPRFVATRNDAQVAVARNGLSVAQKQIVAKVFADNIDTTTQYAPDPNRPVSEQTNFSLHWGKWIMLITGLDGKYFGEVKDSIEHGHIGGDWLSNSIVPAHKYMIVDNWDAIQVYGNTYGETRTSGGKPVPRWGSCGLVLGIATATGGYMVFNPENLGAAYRNKGYNHDNDFCQSLYKSYLTSGSAGNTIIPLATSGTIEW